MARARYGYMGKLLFVDLTNGTFHEEELPEETARHFVGGYGIGARIIMERMKPGADPLGPDNIFGIGTGPLTLSGVYASCRFTTMGKSPLTGYWGDANCGGDFANAFKAAGYDIVFFEGKSEHPVYLLIEDGKVQIKDARQLWGKNTAVTEELIRQENGNSRLKVACVGPAGERMAKIAAVINDRGRAAARSGLGAVMGSKNLKAVAAVGTMRPELVDKPKIQALMKQMMKEAKENPSGMFYGLTHGGSAGAMVAHLHDADVPIKNWKGNNVEDLPESQWDSVALPAILPYLTKKYACTACPIGCGGYVTVEDEKYAVRDAHKPEYETLAAFGTMCLNTDMKSLIYENELCDMYGLDTISAGSTLAFAIECFENGIITKADTDGHELTWGNSEAHVHVLEKMCRREGIGDILADGAMWAAKKLGSGAEQLAMHAGGEMLAMHDPRCFPGWGATYVSDPTPGRHTRGGTAFAEHGGVNEIIYAGLGVPFKLDRYDPTDKGKYHALVAAWQHWANTSGACMFGIDSMPMDFVGCINAITGWGLDYPELAETGKRIATLLHGFNVREGFKPGDFVLPERARGNPPLQAGELKDVTIDSEGLKRQYYEAMGFDPATGVIGRDRIVELGLDDVL